ncbi:MAG: transcriptional repressor [Amycolatopsis sp.]|uniref:LacI family DNA-binding transcriptional regulator n=1 Tax=Amycolatopsis sp. TaxID=37632 RepID=UPI0026393B49|nr:LacI family DNA-binding transcriptional regulator [Amycolatopsis sp.]MCU1685852.1 transcriptional repressor [Amycolatopsis sp.]
MTSRKQGQPKAVTSVDVADAAGVSQSTVSLVISGKTSGRVSAKTQRLVIDTAARLGYRPNVSAQVLRGGRPHVIALAVPNVRHEYFGRVLVAAEQAARAEDMAVVLVDTAAGPEWADRAIAMIKTRLLAGVIVYAEDTEITAGLADATDNLVVVECPTTPIRPSLEIDIGDGMRQVVEHLYGLGHRDIGHARADLDRETFRVRESRLIDELAAHGIDFQPSWQFASSFDLHESTAAAVDFLRDTSVTAVFCDDDLLAASLYRACRILGRDIPGDLSIVGFNDIDLASYLTPELTSVSIPAAELGAAAVRALVGRINGEPGRSSTLPLTLIVRGSTAEHQAAPISADSQCTGSR